MARPRKVRRLWLVLGLLLLWLLCSGAAQASELAQRLEDFPHWQGKPSAAIAQGDLYYPDWFLGEWQAVTTLIDMVAPLAPEITTPGYDSNRAFLDQPISFRVRFVKEPARPWQQLWRSRPSDRALAGASVIADRAFNGLNLAKAYLGDGTVQSVQVDPDNPNQQITRFTRSRQLVSLITERRTEQDSDTFLTTELSQQSFRGSPQLYFNEVETTTRYRLTPEQPTHISADQATAVYLSPQDPNYFKTLTGLGKSRPVALYRYRLDLFSLPPDPL